MHFINTLRDFNVEWEAITTLAKQIPAKVPGLSKTNPPLRWCESFKNVCYNTFGVRIVPLLYVIRDVVDVTPETGTDPDVTYDPCLTNKAHANSGSVLEDMIRRTSHTHALFKQDNATVFTMIEEAARSTHYSIQFNRLKGAKMGEEHGKHYSLPMLVVINGKISSRPTVYC